MRACTAPHSLSREWLLQSARLLLVYSCLLDKSNSASQGCYQPQENSQNLLTNSLSQSQRLIEVKLNADRQLRHLLVMTAPQHRSRILQSLDIRRIGISLHRLQESPSHSTTVFPCNVSILIILSATLSTQANKQLPTALVSSSLHPLYIVTNFCSRLQFLPVLSASSPAGPWC